jgi:hypothetical protein
LNFHYIGVTSGVYQKAPGLFGPEKNDIQTAAPDRRLSRR